MCLRLQDPGDWEGAFTTTQSVQVPVTDMEPYSEYVLRIVPVDEGGATLQQTVTTVYSAESSKSNLFISVKYAE